MAKRSRMSATPGRRRPLDRTPDRGRAGATAVPGPGLTDAELARAAELEAQIVAEEKAAETVAALRVAGPRARGRVGASSEPLSIRAAHEYAYVARDVRRIGLVAGIMFGALIALHLLINVAGIITI